MDRWKHLMERRFFLIHEGVRSAVKTAEFDTDRMSYIIQRGWWCDIIIPNVHAPKRIKVM
jgi:hypothetical protein